MTCSQTDMAAFILLLFAVSVLLARLITGPRPTHRPRRPPVNPLNPGQRGPGGGCNVNRNPKPPRPGAKPKPEPPPTRRTPGEDDR